MFNLGAGNRREYPLSSTRKLFVSRKSKGIEKLKMYLMQAIVSAKLTLKLKPHGKLLKDLDTISQQHNSVSNLRRTSSTMTRRCRIWRRPCWLEITPVFDLFQSVNITSTYNFQVGDETGSLPTAEVCKKTAVQQNCTCNHRDNWCPYIFK